MILSRDRILVTHVGSLPRPPALSDLLLAGEAGVAVDTAALTAQLDAAVQEVVRRQQRVGIDIGNDGEQQRVGFQTYIPQRMTGFGGVSKRQRGLDFANFPELIGYFARRFPEAGRQPKPPQCIGDLHYTSTAGIDAEIARFQRAADAAAAFTGRFMTAPSPGIIATTMTNAHYASFDAYLDALAAEMRHEYLAIHHAGLILQIDAPDLAMERTLMFGALSDTEFVAACERGVAAINKAIDGIPRDRIRLHACYGNWDGPHVHDIALAKILPALYQAEVGALSIEFANPRHAHEYAAFRRHPLPDNMLLLPGVIETTSNIVEHPEVVARRIAEAVAAIGDRERVIASVDCGFGTFTNREWVIEPAVWLKLESLSAGARLASARLWGRSGD